MRTSVLLLALTFTAAARAEAPKWQTSYSKAQTLSQSEQKPIAVFLGDGANGWKKVVESSKVGDETLSLLADKYVPVYVDVSEDQGKEMAKLFRMPEGGIVISSRDGKLQAFRHAGTLSDKDLTSYLKRYASPGHRVVTTETASSTRTSFYAGPGGEGHEHKNGEGSAKVSCANGVCTIVSSSGGCASGSCATVSSSCSSGSCWSSCSGGSCGYSSDCSSGRRGRRGRRCR